MATELIRLSISDITTQGLGVARKPNGKVVMVNNALPGETVLASITEQRKGFALADNKQIMLAADNRVEPPCPYFGLCGGCDLQHLSYPAQLQVKQKWLTQFLRALQPLPPIQVVASPFPLEYRHRIRLHYQPEHGLGFYARHSQKLVAVQDCLLATTHARSQWQNFSKIALPGLREVELLANQQQIHLQLMGPELMPQAIDIPGVALHWPGQKLDMDAGLTYYQQAGITLQAWPGQFSQINWEVNLQMIEHLQQIAKPFIAHNPCTLDLFAGNGNLSLPLTAIGAEVWAVEGNAAACAAGDYQARRNQLHCHFIHAPVHKFLRNPEIKKPGLLVLDPPRTGMKNMIPALLNLKAQAICYISCHPATLARDVVDLTAAGYQLTQLFLFDMFPQTGQMECLALLCK